MQFEFGEKFGCFESVGSCFNTGKDLIIHLSVVFISSSPASQSCAGRPQPHIALHSDAHTLSTNSQWRMIQPDVSIS